MGPKVPKSSARRFPRDCANRGAARGAQDQAYAPPRGGRAAALTLFFRVKRECGLIVPPATALYGMRPAFFLPARRSPTWFRWRKSGRRLKARAAGTVCLQTRAVARRRFQTSGRRHRNRSGGFCCFSPSKSREKSFPELYAESSVFTNFFLLVLLGPKVPKSSARRFPRDCANRGAAARTLFFRVKRECGLIVPPATALYGMRPAFFLPARRSPTWFRWRKSGRKAESESGGDGLLANPRIVARRRFQTSGRRHRNRSGGFCCFSPPKSR